MRILTFRPLSFKKKYPVKEEDVKSKYFVRVIRYGIYTEVARNICFYSINIFQFQVTFNKINSFYRIHYLSNNKINHLYSQKIYLLTFKF